MDAGLRHFIALAVFVAPFCTASLHASDAEIEIQYVVRQIAPPPTLSNIDPIETDIGLQGVRLGIEDSNTTGKFLGQRFVLNEVSIPEDANLQKSIEEQGGARGFIVTNLPASDLLALSDMLTDDDTLIFNAAAADDVLRNNDCRRNVMHTLPSWSMLSDALAQFTLQKRWRNWLLLVGPTRADQQFGVALRKSAAKFGAEIVEDLGWDIESDLRRNAHEEIPRLTNGSEYDVVAVADAVGDFARYLPYNTYHPRPIVGSEGLTPTAWSRVVEQWGAAQLQSRFTEQADRSMRAIDYAAWAAVRSIAEATARTKQTDPTSVRAYLLSDKMQLAGFKGRKMEYRDWNGQLRQPIPLVHTRALVALAPLEGFLHRVTEMDTLGVDRQASNCKAFTTQ